MDTPLLNSPLHPETELLLLFAARREHLFEVIEPNLNAGRIVLCDRYVDSTYAYQGAGRGISIELIDHLRQRYAPLEPDLTIFFDLPPELIGHRLAQRTGATSDRFEREAVDFFENVRNGYLARMAKHQSAGKGIIIDATQAMDEVERELFQKLAPYFEEWFEANFS